MNVNDPYIIAALAHWTGDPSPLDIDWRANDMREADRDRAVLARRKAGEKRHIAAIAGTIEWVHDKPNLNDGRLPESAFDWPVYRAAMIGPMSKMDAPGVWAASEGIRCWLWDNGYAVSDNGYEPHRLAGYMDSGPEQADECRRLRGADECPVHSPSIPESENRALHGDR